METDKCIESFSLQYIKVQNVCIFIFFIESDQQNIQKMVNNSFVVRYKKYDMDVEINMKEIPE